MSALAFFRGCPPHPLREMSGELPPSGAPLLGFPALCFPGCACHRKRNCTSTFDRVCRLPLVSSRCFPQTRKQTTHRDNEDTPCGSSADELYGLCHVTRLCCLLRMFRITNPGLTRYSKDFGLAIQQPRCRIVSSGV